MDVTSFTNAQNVGPVNEKGAAALGNPLITRTTFVKIHHLSIPKIEIIFTKSRETENSFNRPILMIYDQLRDVI